MSTNDVPGYDEDNNDELAMGSWAEHEDGSLILVESTENERVVYSVFDTGTEPITEYRDAMPQDDFQEHFSWSAEAKSKRGRKKDKWTWHDKTPFPWDRIIKEGARDGMRFATAKDQLRAAARVAKSRKLRGHPFDPEKHEHLLEQVGPKGKGVIARIQGAINALRGK